MDETIRRTALRATAKVALAMTVFGCLGEVQVDADEVQAEGDALPEEGDPNANPTLPGAEIPLPSDEEVLACQAPRPDDAVVLDAEQLDCCSDLLEPLIPQDADAWPAWYEVADAPEVQGCCRVAVAHFDDDPAATEVAWETLGPCCEALDYPTGPACTPWGPPVPPAVRGELPLLGGALHQQLEVA